MRAKLLLLDMDDVLVDYRHDIRCRVIAEASGCTPAYAHEAIFDSQLEFRCDRGEFGLEDYLDQLRSDWGLSLSAEDFIAARRQATRVRPSMLTLCEVLSQQAQLAVFTNNADWMHQHLDKTVPELLPLFGRRFVTSGTLGMAKPDPLAFRACLERLGFAPFSALFTDDKQRNVDGAIEAGLDAFVYESEPQFRAALAQRGFDVEMSDAI